MRSSNECPDRSRRVMTVPLSAWPRNTVPSPTCRARRPPWICNRGAMDGESATPGLLHKRTAAMALSMRATAAGWDVVAIAPVASCLCGASDQRLVLGRRNALDRQAVKVELGGHVGA